MDKSILIQLNRLINRINELALFSNIAYTNYNNDIIREFIIEQNNLIISATELYNDIINNNLSLDNININVENIEKNIVDYKMKLYNIFDIP